MLIEDLLKLNDFKILKLLNKNADLTRRIVTVESTETPDVANYMTPNALLLTTGMSYKDNQEGLISLIYTLNNLPCAGLAIKLGRFINKLDEEIIKVADELRFPIFQIPMDMNLGEVYHKVLSCLWNNQNQELLLALNTQKKFSNLVLRGASTATLLDNLGYVLKKPVALMNPYGKVINHNPSCSKEQIELAERTFYEYEIYNKTSGEFASIKDNQINKTSIYSIKNVGQNYYYLFIFNSKREVTALSEMIIEQVLLIFRLSMNKNLYLLVNSLKNKEEFLDVLVNRYKEEFWTSHQLMDIGSKFGLLDSDKYSIILGVLESYEEESFNFDNLTNKEVQYILIFDWIDNKLRSLYGNRVILLPETSYFRYVILLQGKCPDLNDILSEVHHTIYMIFKIKIAFSYGNSKADINSIKYSYKEAIESYRYGEGKGDIDFIKYYKPRNATELLKSVSQEQIQGFCSHILKELAYSQDDMIIELRRTLQIYLECRNSVTATANRMFLHRNTIKYRIKKCEDLLDNELTDSDYCFQLQLALTLLENNN